MAAVSISDTTPIYTIHLEDETYKKRKNPFGRLEMQYEAEEDGDIYLESATKDVAAEKWPPHSSREMVLKSDWPVYNQTSHDSYQTQQLLSSATPWLSMGRGSTPLLNPDRFYETLTPSSPVSKEAQRSKTNQSPRIPHWLWLVFMAVLGVGKKKHRRVIGLLLHTITLMSAVCFTLSGAVFLILESQRQFNNVTVLSCLGKATVGLCWAALGVYAHSLSQRLFTDIKISSWVRAHAKNFLGINMVYVVAVVLMLCVGINLYWDSSTMSRYFDPLFNTTAVVEPNCVALDTYTIICDVYWGSKTIFSVLGVLWNLLCIGVCLSVCRTHTISIRRFQKELLNDAKLFEEFCKIRDMHRNDSQGLDASAEPWVLSEYDGESSEPWVKVSMDHSDSDVDMIADESMRLEDLGTVRNSRLLETFTNIRRKTRARRDSETSSSHHRVSHQRSWSQKFDRVKKQRPTLVSSSRRLSSISSVIEEAEFDSVAASDTVSMATSVGTGDTELETIRKDGPEDINCNDRPEKKDKEDSMESSVLNNRPPIMDNESLYYTHFQLARRLGATSRLLQRWMATWIFLTLVYSCLIIFYWTENHLETIAVSQFVGPLVGLLLVASAYAEVNFEADRLSSCVMPSDSRSKLIIYLKRSPLQVKVYSMPVTHQVITTVVAGIVFTLATKVIIKKMQF